MRFRKPEPIPLMFILAAFALLLSLGIWQMARLTWKEGQLEAIEKAQDLPALTELPTELSGLDYRKVELSGSFLHGKSLRMVGRVRDGGMGFLVLTPFLIEGDGRTILVNRGWAPEGQENRPAGIQTVQGVIRPFREKRLFSPENRADKNIWFYEDIPAMTQTTELALTPLIVEAVGKAEAGIYPIPSDGKISLRNDHLNYAITWFSLALISLIMFALYYRIPDKKP